VGGAARTWHFPCFPGIAHHQHFMMSSKNLDLDDENPMPAKKSHPALLKASHASLPTRRCKAHHILVRLPTAQIGDMQPSRGPERTDYQPAKRKRCPSIALHKLGASTHSPRHAHTTLSPSSETSLDSDVRGSCCDRVLTSTRQLRPRPPLAP
jgi:hypothetical protein